MRVNLPRIPLRYFQIDPAASRHGGDQETNRTRWNFKEIPFKLIVKVPVVGNTADAPNPPGLLPF